SALAGIWPHVTWSRHRIFRTAPQEVPRTCDHWNGPDVSAPAASLRGKQWWRRWGRRRDAYRHVHYHRHWHQRGDSGNGHTGTYAHNQLGQSIRADAFHREAAVLFSAKAQVRIMPWRGMVVWTFKVHGFK